MNHEQEAVLREQYRVHGITEELDCFDDDIYPEWKALRQRGQDTSSAFARLRTAPAWTDPEDAVITLTKRYELRYAAEGASLSEAGP